MPTIGISLQSLTGSTQGLDVNAIIQQLVYAAQAPERIWQAQQQVLQVQTQALTQISKGMSTLLEDLHSLTDMSGSIAAVTTSSSNSSLVTASASPGAALGNHVVVVNNLASTASYYTDPVATADSAISTGTFQIQVGQNTPVSITVDSTNNTMTKLAATINQANIGVTANVVTDSKGARLAIVSNSSGAAGDIAISNDTTGLGFTKPTSGVDASLTVDGVPITSSTNTVTGVVPNVTFNLVGADKNTQVNIGITPDTTTIIGAVNTFVKDYNDLIQSINAGYSIDQINQTAGPLLGDSTGDMVQQQLLDMGTYTVSGAGNYTALSSLGIDMQNDGTFTVDETQLTSAITGDFANFQKFFQGTSGFGTFFSNVLTQATDPTQSAVAIDLQSIQSTKQALQDHIDDLETYLVTQKQQWFEQYNRANMVLQQLPQLEKQIAVQLGYYSNSGGQ